MNNLKCPESKQATLLQKQLLEKMTQNLFLTTITSLKVIFYLLLLKVRKSLTFFRDEYFTLKSSMEAQKEWKYSQHTISAGRDWASPWSVHGNGDHGPFSKAAFWYRIFGVSILAEPWDAKAHHTLR